MSEDKKHSELHTNKYEVVAVGKINIHIIPTDASDEETLARNRDAIDAIWEAKRKEKEEKGGKLFNGTLLSFLRWEKTGDTVNIVARVVEYKQYMAQRARPDLLLGVRPIGVSGLILIKEKEELYAVFAKRSEVNVTAYPGFLELVPSGGIDQSHVRADGTVDYQSQLLSELHEETGLSQDLPTHVSSFALVFDREDNVYDICCEIALPLNKEQFLQNFTSAEYSELPVFVSTNDLAKFVEKRSSMIVPTSIALLNAYGLSR